MRDTGKMIGEPEIISRGFIYLRDADQLIGNVKQTVNDVMMSMRQSRNGKRRERLQELAEQDALQRDQAPPDGLQRDQ